MHPAAKTTVPEFKQKPMPPGRIKITRALKSLLEQKEIASLLIETASSKINLKDNT